MFLREFLDQLSVGAQVQQNYACPMTKCHKTFMAPLQVVQHLLSCPELPNGEFDCDKCNHWHSFPTNEKDWTQWMGWRSQQSLHESHIQRKRSLGSKMREFALRKKDTSRKQNPALESQFKSNSMTGTRPSTAASEAPSTTFTSRGFQHVVFPGQPGQAVAPGFSTFQKPMLLAGLPEVNGGMFWPGFNADVCDMPSTVPSIAPSSTIDESPSEALSQNTSRTTLFSPGLGSYHTPAISDQDSNNASTSQQYMFSTQSSFRAGPTSLSGHPPSISAMSLDEPLVVAAPSLPPTELHPTDSAANHTWWGPKVEEVETPRPTPSSSGPDACFPVQASMAGVLARGASSGISSPTSPCRDGSPYYQVQPASAHCMHRALSHDSMQAGMSTVYGTPVPDGNRVEALSPHADHNHYSIAGLRKGTLESSAEDLVCDECQWKPRGVRENLKGYLRKHKNTHKGLRLSCDVPGCTKTFSRLDNLKKHKRDKHGIEDSPSSIPAKRMAGEFAEHIEDGAEQRRPGTVESEIRGVPEDYSMLWPALHF